MAKHDATETPTSLTLKDISDEVTVTVTTDHAWEHPRGEVYLSMTETYPTLRGGDVEAEPMLGLTPEEAERLGCALITLASIARTRPLASTR